MDSSECFVDCSGNCGAHGECNPELGWMCDCDLGYQGNYCSECTEGLTYYPASESCDVTDQYYNYWPNPAAPSNSHLWLPLHHQQIESLVPKLLVLDFVNIATSETIAQLIDSITSGFAQGSKPLGEGAAQLLYNSEIINMKDGVNGRPNPPSDWPYFTFLFLFIPFF